MIHLDVVQGQAEWHWARLGIPTASNFDRILTPKKREYSKAADTYIHELCAEWLTGIPHGSDSSAFMDRGTDLEARARAYYELQQGVTVTNGGVCLLDSKLAACSPDFLVGDDGGGEIKCRSAAKHVAGLLEGDSEAFAQIQGNLWITGRKWWDSENFNPVLPSSIVRVERDEAYIAALDSALTRFWKDLQVARDTLLALGAVPATKLAQEFSSSLAMRPDSGDPW